MFATALMMGITGSLHCVSMCSPLAMTVSNLTPAVLLNRILYNLGRIVTYGILGLCIGSIASLLPFEKLQNLISVGLGILLLIIATSGMSIVKFSIAGKWLTDLNRTLKQAFTPLLQRKTKASILLLGALNGILPCGLTFLALTFSMTLHDPIKSMTFMLLFGAGTLPAMIGLTVVFQYLVKKYQLSFAHVTTFMLMLSGCLLIIRVVLTGHATPEEQHIVDIVICR